jgi:hypothetical protein
MSGSSGPSSFPSTLNSYSGGTENPGSLPNSGLPGASTIPTAANASLASQQLAKGEFQGEELARSTGLSQSLPRAGMQQGDMPYSPSSSSGSSGGGKSSESDRKKRRGANKATSEQSAPSSDPPEEQPGT